MGRERERRCAKSTARVRARIQDCTHIRICRYYVERFVGPDGHLYGYMYTACHAVMKEVEDQALFVNDLPLPPYLMFRGGRSGNGK